MECGAFYARTPAFPPYIRGVLAHLVERFHGMEEVRSSNLLYSTTIMTFRSFFIGVIRSHQHITHDKSLCFSDSMILALYFLVCPLLSLL